MNIPEIFGENVFNEKIMQERLPKDVFNSLKNTIEQGKMLDLSVANAVATAMKEWAISKGATHFTHWFQPMTGITAEKHDSFISPTDDGGVIMEFSGKELVKGESDASSFPNGGIRATFEARGYTAWDPTSFAFLKDDTLYIPTAFCSYSGEVLDKKAPLLRSMESLNKQALRILRLMGDTETTRVNATVGAEQEYFLVDKKMWEKRKDLIFTGRTLFGARPPKGQELSDHYYGAIKPRVLEFMKDLDQELWKLGILAKTEHNEVAPAQHELAPVFSIVNNACDNNQLTMEVMKKVAQKHDMVCLLHEKPFENINGSGKHNNWALSTNTGINLFNLGKTPQENARFMLFFSAVVKAVDEYQDLLRISISTASNDSRLGGHEAPPVIISMYTGDELENIINAIERGEKYETGEKKTMTLGVDTLPQLPKDTTDRNRTSPFAFTGNKFEFRMLGSSLSISCPNIMLNSIVADELEQFADILEKADDFDKALNELVAKTLKEHKRIIFNGNNYSAEWTEEAKRRGLSIYKDTPEALPHYTDEKNVKMFERQHIYTKREIESRTEILLDSYSKIRNIEALTMIDMARADIYPAVNKYLLELCKLASYIKEIDKESYDTQSELIATLSKANSKMLKSVANLEKLVNQAKEVEDVSKKATFFADVVLPEMENLRKYADEMEQLTDSKYWPFPVYGDLLFSVL